MLSSLTRLVVLITAACTTGCTTTPRQCWESLKGEGFPGWSESLASGARGNTKDARPSGFFTDRRSEQIERDLGGGF
jgi:hypothetical protein